MQLRVYRDDNAHIDPYVVVCDGRVFTCAIERVIAPAWTHAHITLLARIDPPASLNLTGSHALEGWHLLLRLKDIDVIRNASLLADEDEGENEEEEEDGEGEGEDE